jgi:hypothetical protein
MVTLGFTFSYSDSVVNDTAFPFVSSYILIGGSGDLVYEAPDGSAQWLPSAPIGYNPIAAKRVLSNGVVNGVARVTTSTSMVYCAAPKF